MCIKLLATVQQAINPPVSKLKASYNQQLDNQSSTKTSSVSIKKQHIIKHIVIDLSTSNPATMTRLTISNDVDKYLISRLLNVSPLMKPKALDNQLLTRG